MLGYLDVLRFLLIIQSAPPPTEWPKTNNSASPCCSYFCTLLCLQDTVLFNDTLRANVQYGRLDASPKEVRSQRKAERVCVCARSLHAAYECACVRAHCTLSMC